MFEGQYQVSHSIIGVGVAIIGNIFISVSLNLQKYAHNKISLQGNPVSYLHSKTWWLGIAIMIIGEMGNFAAYGFAPAVLVSPLGTVALISNLVIAPMFLNERIRPRDIAGISFSVLGTLIIVFVSSGTNEPTLSVDDILDAISQPLFLIYFICTMLILGILFKLSKGSYGKKYIVIDLLIASIIGNDH